MYVINYPFGLRRYGRNIGIKNALVFVVRNDTIIGVKNEYNLM